jgi:hypothetical protein
MFILLSYGVMAGSEGGKSVSILFIIILYKLTYILLMNILYSVVMITR